MIRTLLIVALLTLGSAAKAQPSRTWEAQVEHNDPDVSPKPVFAGLMNGLPGCDLQFVRKTGMITIVTPLSFEIPWLEGVLNDAGFTLVGLWLEGADLFADPEEEAPVELSVPATGSNTLPTLNDVTDDGQ